MVLYSVLMCVGVEASVLLFALCLCRMLPTLIPGSRRTGSTGPPYPTR